MFVAKAPALATLRPGSPWVEVDARLGRRADEPVLVKLFASAFFGTELDELLRDAGLRHGRSSPARPRRAACARPPSTRSSTATACSCRGTAVADRALDAHNGSLLDIDAKYGDVISIDEAIAAVEARGHERRQPTVERGPPPSSPSTSARVVFGAGVVGRDRESTSRRLGVTRALVVCDPFVTASGLGERLRGVAPRGRASSRSSTTASPASRARAPSRRPIEAARDGFDGFVGIGGGSALDTAKLCALFATHDGELLDYVNAPIGRGTPVPGPVLPVRRAADDLRHGIRGHDGRGRRLPAARDEDRRLAPAPPAGARDRRPGADRCRARRA